jgi:hypothetical protein
LIFSTSAPGKVFSIPNNTPIFFTLATSRQVVQRGCAPVLALVAPQGMVPH